VILEKGGERIEIKGNLFYAVLKGLKLKNLKVEKADKNKNYVTKVT